MSSKSRSQSRSKAVPVAPPARKLPSGHAEPRSITSGKIAASCPVSETTTQRLRQRVHELHGHLDTLGVRLAPLLAPVGYTAASSEAGQSELSTALRSVTDLVDDAISRVLGLTQAIDQDIMP